jgi:hypothetical protein
LLVGCYRQTYSTINVKLTLPSSTASAKSSSACLSRSFTLPSWRHNADRDMLQVERVEKNCQ